jgi:hypothetical protein
VRLFRGCVLVSSAAALAAIRGPLDGSRRVLDGDDGLVRPVGVDPCEVSERVLRRSVSRTAVVAVLPVGRRTSERVSRREVDDLQVQTNHSLTRTNLRKGARWLLGITGSEVDAIR